MQIALGSELNRNSFVSILDSTRRRRPIFLGQNQVRYQVQIKVPMKRKVSDFEQFYQKHALLY